MSRSAPLWAPIYSYRSAVDRHEIASEKYIKAIDLYAGQWLLRWQSLLNKESLNSYV